MFICKTTPCVMERNMLYVWMIFTVAGIVAFDQLSKLWVVSHIPLHTYLPGIKGIFNLTYVQNTGAAFSSFQGMQWLFALIFVVFTAAIFWCFLKNSLPFSRLEKWCIVCIWAGGLGNMIDRLRLGYVVDMINLEFMHFPVFNVADCFITCGCVLLMVSLIFFNRQFWKDEKK